MAENKTPGAGGTNPQQPGQPYGNDPFSSQKQPQISPGMEEYDKHGQKVQKPGQQPYDQQQQMFGQQGQGQQGQGQGQQGQQGYGGRGDNPGHGYDYRDQYGKDYDRDKDYDREYDRGRGRDDDDYGHKRYEQRGYGQEGYIQAQYPPAYAPMNGHDSMKLQQKLSYILRMDMTKMSSLFDIINKRGLLAHQVLNNWNQMADHDKGKASVQLQHLNAALKDMLALL